MRLVLPEHRVAMKVWQRERNEKQPPCLSDDATQQMHDLLSKAIDNASRVRLTLFGAQADTVLEGVPKYDGRLKVTTDEGVQTVDVDRLIAVERV